MNQNFHEFNDLDFDTNPDESSVAASGFMTEAAEDVYTYFLHIHRALMKPYRNDSKYEELLSVAATLTQAAATLAASEGVKLNKY